MDDDRLMQRASQDDTRAFGQLVRTHQQKALRFATRMLGDSDAAQDAVQEAFLRVWRGRERYRPQGHFGCFLLRIVRNVCLDTVRAPRRTEELCVEPVGAQGVAAHVEATAFSEAVRAAVLNLPEPQRVVFVLSHYEGLAYRDIAELLECPVGTVASRKHQALEALRRRLGGWANEESV